MELFLMQFSFYKKSLFYRCSSRSMYFNPACNPIISIILRASNNRKYKNVSCRISQCCRKVLERNIDQTLFLLIFRLFRVLLSPISVNKTITQAWYQSNQHKGGKNMLLLQFLLIFCSYVIAYETCKRNDWGWKAIYLFI